MREMIGRLGRYGGERLAIPVLTILAAAMNVATDPPIGPPVAAVLSK